jgi:Zn finger protein HypA/HybF involved in hydrogenase expression
MHAYTAVKHMVQELRDRLEDEPVQRVISVFVRRSSTVSEDELLRAFAGLSFGTVLEGADLTVETFDIVAHCDCGHEQVITHANLSDGVYVCPQCSRSFTLQGEDELEVVNVIVEEPRAQAFECEASSGSWFLSRRYYPSKEVAPHGRNQTDHSDRRGPFSRVHR